MSKAVPRLDPYGTTPLLSTAPTAMALDAHAGELTPEPSLPAAATTVISDKIKIHKPPLLITCEIKNTTNPIKPITIIPRPVIFATSAYSVFFGFLVSRRILIISFNENIILD